MLGFLFPLGREEQKSTASQIIRYAFAGFANTIVTYGLYSFFLIFIGSQARVLVAYLLAVGIATIVGYTLSARFVFLANETGAFSRYLKSQPLILVFASLVAALAETLLKNEVAAFLTATLVMAALGFLSQRYFVFKPAIAKKISTEVADIGAFSADEIETYVRVQQGGLVGWGNSRANAFLRRRFPRIPEPKVLEIGGSSGEHLRFWAHKNQMSYPQLLGSFKHYAVVDPNVAMTNPALAKQLRAAGRVTFVRGVAEDLPFEQHSFDICLSTCVLAHAEDPRKVFTELRRVTRPGGTLLVAMPTDAGFANTVVKMLVTYPKLRSNDVDDPKTFYRESHKNDIRVLLQIVRQVFEADQTRLTWWPFSVRSIHANLLVGVQITINPDRKI
jgi:ubiquinone/menaquinone biosynthesis C-methylase UbiE/putative flippase GtrA